MIGIYLQSAPWAVPATVVVAVVLLAAHLRRIRDDPWRGIVGYLFWLAVGGFLAVTLAPNPRGGTSRTLSLDPSVPGVRELLSTSSQTGLNALIGIPVGLFGALLALTTRRRLPVVVAFLVPLCAEGVQWLVPSLRRVAFYLSDVTSNWCGVVIGMAVGLILGGLVALGPRAGSGRLSDS